MLDIKQATWNMFTQIELYGRSGKLIQYSLIVKHDNHNQLVLAFRPDWNQHGGEDHNTVILTKHGFAMTVTEKVKQSADRDMLNALKEIGNAHIRFLNSRHADEIDTHELIDNGHEG